MDNFFAKFGIILDVCKHFSKDLAGGHGNMPRRGVVPKFSDLEVIALALTAETESIDSESRLFSMLKSHSELMPNLISRRQYNDRRKYTAGLCGDIRKRVAARLGSGGLSHDTSCIIRNDQMVRRTDLLFWHIWERINKYEYRKPEKLDIVRIDGKILDEAYKFNRDKIPLHLHAEIKIEPWKLHKIIENLSWPIHPSAPSYPPEEPEVFFYHSDHLGGASWITDGDGNPVQHLQYLPFGQPFVDQHPAGYQERFTFTGKERDEETGFGYFGARYMAHSLLTSFISVDRYADKYPFISPYAYCAWNPIRLIDPTGDTICINGQHYTPGMSSDGLDEFSKKAVDALNTMYGTDEGRSLIDNLGSSDNIFTIEEAATSEFKPIDRRRASLAQLKTDPYGQKEYQRLLDIGFDFNGGSGGTILWNSAGSILPTEEGGKVCATTDLAHEMFHALDANQGLLDHRDEKGIPRKEWQAVYRENILRGQMGLPLRTHYRKQMTSNGEFVGGSGEMMISRGKPIKPLWY